MAWAQSATAKQELYEFGGMGNSSHAERTRGLRNKKLGDNESGIDGKNNVELVSSD